MSERSTRMAATGAEYEEKFVTVGGLRFRYLEWGKPNAPAMVLLHGSGWTAHDWDFFAPAFRDEYHIFVPDQRGRGRSEVTDPPSFTTGDHVQDLRGLVQVWGIDTAVLIGLSMGGHNAMAYASQYPDNVSALVVVDCPPSFEKWGDGGVSDWPAFESLDALVAWYTTTFAPRSSPEILRHVWEHGAQRLPDGRLLAFACPSYLALDPAGRRQAWPTPDDLWNAIGHLTCPVLIVRGDESELLSAEVAVQMARSMPHARLVTIDGAGHTVPFDRPVEFEAAIRRFLSQLNRK